MRWTPNRKAEVLDAIRSGEISAAEAERLHGISAEELESWRRRDAQHGTLGLRATNAKMARAS